jgi:predicted flap endonuclease-1-like 5' DNA nuclease
MSLTLTAVALVVVLIGGYAWGHVRARRIQAQIATNRERAAAAALEPERAPAPESAVRTVSAEPATAMTRREPDPLDLERARLVRAYDAECARLRGDVATVQAECEHLRALAEERRALFAGLAEARAEAARYRQLVLDIENSAPPPLLGGRGTPDDLKLIVGIGPVLERMLHQLGITTYRQIARWTERDIDDFDARLAEFPGRIRRDGWVTQARALHQSVYGEALPR